MEFLYHTEIGIFCNKDCAKDKGICGSNLRKLETTSVDDFDTDFEGLDKGEDSDYWCWTEEADGSFVCSPRYGRCCSHCWDVLFD